jgi:hypothetical protein
MSAMCDRSAGAKSSSDVDHVGKLLLTWLCVAKSRPAPKFNGMRA